MENEEYEKIQELVSEISLSDFEGIQNDKVEEPKNNNNTSFLDNAD